MHSHTYFLGSSTSERFCTNLTKEELIKLGLDGPKSNKVVWNHMNNDILKSRSKRYLDIGTCNLHVVNNAFVLAHSEFCSDANK